MSSGDAPRKPLDVGRDVLRTEADAIGRIGELLDDAFTKAVEAVVACRGLVIVSGVGKPWFIAQKISATLASTGTPSFPLHPADALHGDIGRVGADDIVLLLSNSGASDEVTRLLPLIRQFGATLIGMTGNRSSPLAREATVVLDYGEVTEACPLGLAPSTSSTAMLALGDALALAVLEARRFTADDYARYHPAGALGRKLMKVAELMRPPDRTPIVPATAAIRDVLAAITGARAGAALITAADGTLAGIFTDGDLRRHLAGDLSTLDEPVEAHMTRQPRTIGPDRLVADALRLMREHRIDELPVVDNGGRPLGHLDVQDLLDIGLAIAP